MPSTVGIVASAVVPFSPLDLNPQLWIDAADLSTLTVSGSSVTAWANKGSLDNLAQSSSTAQPQSGLETVNGLNVVTFNGSSHWMTSPSAAPWDFLHNGTAYIVAGVVKWSTTASPNNLYVLYSTQNSAFQLRGTWLGMDSRSPRVVRLRQVVANNSQAAVIAETGDNATVGNSTRIISALTTPSASPADRTLIYDNAVDTLAVNTATQAPVTGDPFYPFRLGRLQTSSGDFWLQGFVAELVIVAGANATEINRQALRDYLNEKWAVY
jgi:hypothetical protein